MESDLDKEYLPIIVDPIRVCAAYTPKMGGKNSKGGDTWFNVADICFVEISFVGKNRSAHERPIKKSVFSTNRNELQGG